MKTSQKGFIVPLLLIIVAVLLAGGGAYFYTQKNTSENPAPTGDVVLPQATSTTQTSNPQTKVASQLALDLANVTPQFIDENGYGGLQDGKPLPVFATTIKKDIAAIFTPTDNQGYHLYSKAENIYLVAIGKRYVIFGDKEAKEGYSGELFDSVTNTSLPMGPWASQIFHTDKFAVYVSPTNICTYTLDQPLCTILSDSKLTGSERYWDPPTGEISIEETHTNNSLKISAFDSSKGGYDSKVGKWVYAKREITFPLSASGQTSNPNMGGGLCPTGQAWSGPISAGGCVFENWKSSDNPVYSFKYPQDLTFQALQTRFVDLAGGYEADVPASYNLSNSFQRSQKIYVGINGAKSKETCMPTLPSTSSAQYSEFIAPITVAGFVFNKYQTKGDCAMDGCSIGNTYTNWVGDGNCYEVSWFAIQSSPSKLYNGPTDPRTIAAQTAADATTQRVTLLTEQILSTFRFHP